jgi:hypothetical protein
VDVVDRKRVEVVPALAPAPLDLHQVGRFENFEMLHHRAAIEVRKLTAERAGGERLVAKSIKDRAPVDVGERAEHAVLLLRG